MRPETFVWLPRPVFKRTGDTPQSLLGRGQGPGPAPAPSWPLTIPLLVGAGLEETMVSSWEGPTPGSWAPEASPGLPGQEAGGSVAHGARGPDTWGVPTGMAWPEWGQSSARLIPGRPPRVRAVQASPPHLLSPGPGAQVPHTLARAESRRQYFLKFKSRPASYPNCSITGPLVLNRECLVIF